MLTACRHYIDVHASAIALAVSDVGESACRSSGTKSHIGKKEQVYLFHNKSPLAWDERLDYQDNHFYPEPRLRAGQVFASPKRPD